MSECYCVECQEIRENERRLNQPDEVDVTCHRCGETYTVVGPFPREYVCFCGNSGILPGRESK